METTTKLKRETMALQHSGVMLNNMNEIKSK